MKSLSRLTRRLRGWGRAWNQHFTRPVGELMTGVWRRGRWWLRGMTFRLFLQGLPALLAGVGLVVLTAFSLTAPAHEVESRYLEQGRAAFQARDYALAMTCFERVCAQGQERPEILFELALTAEALGQWERTVLIMRQLAPPDSRGYGEAHVWLARRLLMNRPLTEGDRQAAQTHLLLALKGEVKDREWAQGMLGDLYLSAGHLDQAEPLLTKAVRARPEFLLALAEVTRRRGDWESARRHAQTMARHFQQRTARNLRDHVARVNWAQAVTFLQEFPEAVAILVEGWNVTGEPLYRLALGDVYAAWCHHQVQNKGEKAHEQFGLVEKGLAWSPANPALVNRLLAAVTAGGEEADKVRDTLRELLADGKAPGVAHFALGVDAWQRGEKREAGVHWEQAYRLAPHLTEVANTLAMHLADADPPDLPRALQIINLVLEKSPDQPNYRDTRGQIYVKLGKWQEALPDLEAAVSKSPDNVGLHRRLATVYERLSVAGMAAQHQRRADQLAAKQKARG